MKMYPGDLLADEDVAGLSPEAFGIWIKVLLYMWKGQSGTYRKTETFMARVMNCTIESLHIVLAELEENGVGDIEIDGDWITICNTRVQDDLDEIESEKERQRDRYQTGKKVIPHEFPKDSPEIPLPFPEDEYEDEYIKTKKVSKFPFSDLWDQYRKKIGKKKAETIWDRMSEKDRALAMNHVPLFVEATPDKEYRPNLSTYLNQRRWEDEELPSVKGDSERLLTHREMIDTGKSMNYFEMVTQKTGKPLWKLK